MVGCDAATTLIAYSDGLQLQWLVDRSLDMSAATRAAIGLTVVAEAHGQTFGR